MNRNEEILGMIHRVMGLTRRGPHGTGDVPSRPHGHCCPPPPPADGDPVPNGTLSFRERGRILIHLEREDGITQKELAERLSIRPQSLSELIYKLEQDGMIIRKTKEADRRAVLVYLTEEARARLDLIKEGRRRFAEEFLSPLTEQEREQLAAILQKLIDAKTEEKSDVE